MTGPWAFAVSLSANPLLLAYDNFSRSANVWMATVGPDGISHAAAAKQITT
jgi:hypothetical protein